MSRQYVSPSAKKVLAVAISQLGYHEGRDKNGNWNNDEKYAKEVPGLSWANFQAWCAVFVSWVAMKAGFASLYPRTASTDEAATWYQKRGQFNEHPAIAAQGFLANHGDEHHTFLVEDFDDTYVYSIDGNSNTSGSSQGDGVYRVKRLRRDPDIEGYGYPAFPEGIVTADPNYKGKRAVRPAGAGGSGGSVQIVPAAPAKKAPAKTPIADKGVEVAQKGLNAAQAHKQPKKAKRWRTALNALKGLSSKY